MTNHRPIDIDGMKPVALRSQAAPQLHWIPLDQLVIDDRYQRPLGPKNRAAIQAIAGDFRWARFSPVLVAPVEGGRFAIIDGQHRAHAAALCGIESIPAMVVLVATEEQAQAFIEVNTRQIRVDALHVYRAALTAGEPWAVACHDAVAAAGCRLMTGRWSASQKKPGMVFCVTLIRDLICKCQAGAVTTALAALMEFSPDRAENFSEALLKPFLTAVADCGGTVDDWVAVLHAKRPWLVLENADRLAKQTGANRTDARKAGFVSLFRERAAA